MIKLFKRFLLLLLVAAAYIYSSCGQISSGGVPAGVKISGSIPVIDFSGKLSHEMTSVPEPPPGKNTPLRFAIPLMTDIDPLKDGIWTTTDNGTRIWQVIIRCKEARSLSFIFDRYNLERGEKLYVYEPSGKQILGAFTYRNNKTGGTLALAPLKGGTAVISWEVPGNHTVTGKLHLDRVGLGFRDIFGNKETKDQFFGSSGPCNVDISCPGGEAWQVEKNSVVRIFVNGTYLCSGVLVNTVSNDATPYILTAGHCITDSAGAANSVFVFGYESPYCNGPDGSVNKSVSGSALKARGENSLDFTLVQMSRIPPFTYYPYYAGWNSSENIPSSSVAIHHPNGDVKKISVDYDSPGISGYDIYDNNTFWNILQWDIGTTEPGSSGGALFDQNHRLIGTLSGGDARCGSSVNDYFQMLHFMWDAYPAANKQIKYWLDPGQLGFPFWNGYDPYEVSKKTCDTLTNIADGEILMLYEYPGVNAGYRTGHNADRTSRYAEVFFNNTLFSMTGVYIMPGIINFDSPSDKVTVKIWSYDTAPGTVIVEKDVPMNFFQDSVWNFIDFDTIVTVTGNFFAGYEIYYDNPTGPLTDQFAVMQVEARNVYGENFAYYYQNGQWTTFSGTPPDYMYTSLAVQPVLCGEMPSVNIRPVPRSGKTINMQVFPNPASKEITLIFPRSLSEAATIELTDMTGRKILSRNQVFYGIDGTIILPALPDGIYIIRVITSKDDFRTRIMIRNK